MHKHCLRFNQLETFEIYSMNRETWNKYNIATQQLTVVSYKQQIPYSYQYFIGSYIDTETNYSSNSTLNIVSWNEFIQQTKSTLATFVIIQYSDSKCVDFSSCYQKYTTSNNIGDNLNNFGGFVFAEITQKYEANINSQLTSNVLDFHYIRDILQFIIMFIGCIWLILALDLFDNANLDAIDGLKVLSVPIFFLLCYYLLIFTLSVIPIIFVTPARLTDLNYAEINAHSLTFAVGDYYAPWWISGNFVFSHCIRNCFQEEKRTVFNAFVA